MVAGRADRQRLDLDDVGMSFGPVRSDVEEVKR
jgi:hypothetical protein